MVAALCRTGCGVLGGHATYGDAKFDRCSLLLLAGAQATLSKAAFSSVGASQSGLSMLVHGACSKLSVRGTTVAGGTQGVAVQAGGHLDATAVTITGVDADRAELQGGGSCLTRTRCKLHSSSKFRADDEGDGEGVMLAVGVNVHTSSSAHLSSLSVSGPHVLGVHVASRAAATLDGCNVSESATACVGVRVRGSGRLISCTLSGGVGMACLEVWMASLCTDQAAACMPLHASFFRTVQVQEHQVVPP